MEKIVRFIAGIENVENNNFISGRWIIMKYEALWKGAESSSFQNFQNIAVCVERLDVAKIIK